MWDLLIRNLRMATMDPAQRRPFGVTDADMLAIAGGRIVWMGKAAARPRDLGAKSEIDAGGRWLTPGLIDCHTHLVFAGSRIEDFRRRLAGESYEDIAKAGGGILSTVRATRAADHETLLASALPRLADMARGGVTTIEIKSGYGLDRDTEIRMLETAGALGDATGLRIRRSFLGGHKIAPEYEQDRDGYVDFLCETMIPEIAARGFADAVDAFHETVGLREAEIERLFSAARRHGLAVRLHADQLSNGHGGALAARHGALSADHLEWLDAEGVAAMAAAGTTAVLLPGAYHFLGETRQPPVAALRAAGVPMAVASDLNPGSSPLRSPLLVLSLAVLRFGLSPEEALAGMTLHAAKALGLAGETGRIAPGMRADLALWDIEEPTELCYWMGGDPLHMSLIAGKPPKLARRDAA